MQHFVDNHAEDMDLWGLSFKNFKEILDGGGNNNYKPKTKFKSKETQTDRF